MSIALNRLGALDAARKLQRRELTAVQLVRACFARIEQRENTIHAWTALQKQAALEHAEQLDKGPLRGPLHGLPIGVKDLFDTVDLPTRYGSPIYERHHPGLDAAAVALCRGAGAVVVGKTVTTEFATYTAGPTRNPRNEAHTPGGSSSGSAAAVADDMVPFALGSQTAGSIIRPASYCGIVGFKPTFGAIPRAGVKSLAESLDTVGGFARSVPDIALFASVLMRDPRMLDLNYDAAAHRHVPQPAMASRAGRDQEAYAQAAAILARAGAQVGSAAAAGRRLHAGAAARRHHGLRGLAIAGLRTPGACRAAQRQDPVRARSRRAHHGRGTSTQPGARRRGARGWTCGSTATTCCSLPAPAARRPSPTWARAIRSSRAAGRCSACPA